ncbi:MAG: glutaredoxin family protein [Candidatus Coatesbacteria bacterium]|nr:glutaredoxin family protein [Candidatus Coatesbacteria bacterium]
MEIVTIEGKDCGEVFIYALSTCIWCKKTKNLLHELGVKYSYVDVDLVEGDEQDKVYDDMKKFSPDFSFPTVVIDKSKCIIGYKENDIKSILETK